MPCTIDVQDLKLGMFIRLETGWLSHPFPLSSFRISSAEQIVIIRGLGLKTVRWYPEKSEIVETASPAFERLDQPVDPGPPACPAPDPEPSAEDEGSRQAARWREQLRTQRQALEHCQAQYDEATQSLQQVCALVHAQPRVAAQQAQALAATMLQKMLGDAELCIRLLPGTCGDRSAAHAINVTVISLLMGRTIGLPENELLELGTGALLHDIGKLDLPPGVRTLDEGFDSTELKAYRNHVALGVARARQMDLSAGALAVLAQHHELGDRSGFPQGLSLDAITPAARLVALVNRYDNLCNPASGAAPLTPHEAVSTLFAQNRGRFDMSILSSFIRMMGVYPAGSVVQLTDDRHALVMQVNSSRPLKPRVLVHDPEVPRDEALLLDLAQTPDLGIRRSLAPAKLPPTTLAYLAPRQRVSYYFDHVEPRCEERLAELSEAS